MRITSVGSAFLPYIGRQSYYGKRRDSLPHSFVGWGTYFTRPMLLAIQFPLADSRAFSSRTGLLNRPNWPAVIPDDDFVRSFGVVRRRGLGGFRNWIGEHALCEADRALRFRRSIRFVDNDEWFGWNVALRVAYRRFFFNGLSAGKFELGLTAREGDLYNLTRGQVKEMLNHVLHLPVSIPNPLGQAVCCELWQAGRYLAGLYAASSVTTSQLAKQTIEDWLVKPAPPLLFLVYKSFDHIPIPFKSVLLPISENINFDLLCSELPFQGRNLRMWVAGPVPDYDWKIAREMRITLLRLNAESECLKLILRNIATGKIVIMPGTKESDALQRYLNKATRNILRLESKSETLSGSDVLELARQSKEIIDVGEREAILEALDKIGMRPNISGKVERYVNLYIGENIMGDKNIVKQAGAVGSHARAEHFDQYMIEAQGLNLSALATELSELRVKLKEEASEPEHDITIGEIAAAETSARQGDGSKALAHLSKAGEWALDVATKIGSSLAVEALKKATGL